MFTDWQQVGVFPCQDHDPAVPLSGRMQLVGGRIRRWAAPETGAAPEQGLLEYAVDGAQGTLGDIHPWLFWQTRDQNQRGMGSWSMAWAGQVGDARAAGGGPTTGGASPQTEVNAVGYGDWTADLRYVGKTPGWPRGFPRPVKGQVVAIFPATSERYQSELMLNGDPRLISAWTAGPGDCSTLVCDLQPTAEPCMDGSTTPGMGGRQARLSTFLKVVPLSPSGPTLQLPNAPGNFLAWNFMRTQQENYAGYGAIWGPLDGSSGPITGGGSVPGPITGGGSVPGPITGGGATGGLLLDDSEEVALDPAGVDAEMLTDAWGRIAATESPAGWGSTDAPAKASEASNNNGKTPSDYGKFVADPRLSTGVGFMAAVQAGGPITLGSREDKHKLGTDRDGNSCNSAHISTDALFYRNSRNDAPLFFEGDYPKVSSMPLRSPVHLTYDRGRRHAWVGTSQEGLWRWYAEVPDVKVPIPADKPVLPPTPPTPGGPSTPGSPGAPGGPTTPGPGGPTAPPPGGPATGGPAGPTAPAPAGPPGAPAGPAATGGGGKPKAIPWPITPNPGGKRFPGYPATPPATTGGPAGPSAPTPGGAGSPATPGPTTPGGGTKPRDDRSGWAFPAGRPPGLEQAPRLLGTEVVDEYGNDVAEGANDGIVQRVGDAIDRSTGPYQLWRPFMSGFAGLALRPQLWAARVPSLLHNPSVGDSLMQADEQMRPTVLTMVAWGAQSSATQDFVYAESPGVSIARGGAASGGLLMLPPQLRMEDYFGLGDTPTAPTPTTQSWLTAAPGVGFALGTPHTSGGLSAASIQLVQAASGNQAVTLSQLDAARAAQELLRAELHAASGERQVGFGGTGAVKIPRGTTAQRPTNISPTGGELRVNTSSSPEVLEFYDGAASTWRTVSGGGGGGGGGLITNGDYTAASGLMVVGRWTNSAGALQQITLGKGLEFDSSSIRIKSLDVSTTQLGDDITATGKAILTQSTKAGMRSYLELNSYNPLGW